MTYDQVCAAFEAGQLSAAGLTTCQDIEALIKQLDVVPAGVCCPEGPGTKEAICFDPTSDTTDLNVVAAELTQGICSDTTDLNVVRAELKQGIC